MQLRKHIGISLFALLIIIATIYGFLPKPVPVDIVQVSRKPLQVTVEEEGRTRVIDRYAISTPVAGYAQRIELDVGDAITQGQTLVSMDPLPSTVLDPRSRAQAQAQVNRAEDALRAAKENANAAKASYDFAKVDYERIKELCKTQCASKADEDKIGNNGSGHREKATYIQHPPMPHNEKLEKLIFRNQQTGNMVYAIRFQLTRPRQRGPLHRPAHDATGQSAWPGRPGGALCSTHLRP